jgi:hypothetical protein
VLQEKIKMNSSNSGLVRRTNAAKGSGSEYNGSSTSTPNDHNDNFKSGSEDENMEETSDKETRLTLMEEVLLLGLKDKEVRERNQNRLGVTLSSMHRQKMRIREKEEFENGREREESAERDTKKI